MITTLFLLRVDVKDNSQTITQLLKRHSFYRISKTTGSRLATAPYVTETNSVNYQPKFTILSTHLAPYERCDEDPLELCGSDA